MSIECRDLRFAYPTPDGPLLALDGINLAVQDEEFLCIVGPSGCGKSTLLKLVAGLLQPTTGSIEMGNDDGDRRPAAMVFQEHGLYPWMSVLDNVCLQPMFRGVDPAERHQQAYELLRQFGLAEFIDHFPHQLSVGMKQRVSLARAFITEPRVLLMDEPFAALDALNKVVLQEELLRIWRRHRTQVIYITHDIDEALLLGDRILVMSGKPGRIRESIPVPLDRPRQREDLARPEVAACKAHIWKSLEVEVRRVVGSTL
jgi:NitT/TauT family transport system ATP-binding protein